MTGTRPVPPVLCAIAVLALVLALPPAEAGGAGPARLAPIAERRPVCIRGACFDAEIAATEDERAQGLMYRETLPSDRGMLFVFPAEGRHQFWMRNTRIELDIVFIGADRRVVSIAHRAQPCRSDPCPLYTPAGDVAYVLEIAGGTAASRGFAPGDLVEFRQSGPPR